MNGYSDSSHLAVAFRYNRQNCYSFLALMAASETYPDLNHVSLYWVHPTSALSLEAVLEKLAGRHHRIVLCYSLMTPQWPKMRQELLSLATHPHRKRLFLIAGGPHPSGAPKRTLEAGFDAVCVGEGEEAFPRLLRAAIRVEKIEEIPGLYIRRKGKTHFTRKARRANWDMIPPLPFQHGKFGPIEITRGCPYGCKYCQTPVLKGRKVRHRSPDSIFEAVERMVESDRTDVRFITPNALAYGSSDGRRLNLHSLHRLLDGIRKRLPPHGRIFFGSFPSEVRPEFVTHQSVELIRTFCDNRMVVLGAQSGNMEMLRMMRRGHGPEEVRRACEILIKGGLHPVVDFIVGFPGETVGQMLGSVSFMEELAEIGARLHTHTFMPLAGTPWAALPPQPIPDIVRKRLELLISRGRLFGQWQQQERMFQSITVFQ